MLLPSLLISIPVLALTAMLVWALWHLIYDPRTLPQPTPIKNEVNLEQLTAQVGFPYKAEVKQTPATTHLHLPPPVLSGRSNLGLASPLHGLGGGSWSFQRRLVPKQYRRWPRLDPF